MSSARGSARAGRPGRQQSGGGLGGEGSWLPRPRLLAASAAPGPCLALRARWAAALSRALFPGPGSAPLSSLRAVVRTAVRGEPDLLRAVSLRSFCPRALRSRCRPSSQTRSAAVMGGSGAALLWGGWGEAGGPGGSTSGPGRLTRGCVAEPRLLLRGCWQQLLPLRNSAVCFAVCIPL